MTKEEVMQLGPGSFFRSYDNAVSYLILHSWGHTVLVMCRYDNYDTMPAVMPYTIEGFRRVYAHLNLVVL